ncbi:hypothetical protein PVK06_011830 [Gossypium arboreum]|uniref:Uncharacterized protein n=1 Tax=Gossypium arboreum TaxID=29729 RepID=A0ABR0QA00_GOSAR|nr:hypothetical protein PVK06_011830 [Gossypium arboreum]
MEKGGSSKEVGIEVPKFKLRKVSAVRDFPPGCGRGTMSDFELHWQIAIDQSSQEKLKVSLRQSCESANTREMENDRLFEAP